MDIQSNSPLQKVPKNYALGEAYNHWFTIPEGPDKGKKLFYYDYQTAQPSEKVVLFVHGNPECSYTYRHIRDEIVKSKTAVRIIAMDHIGFGISDRATYEMIDIHHAFNLKLLIKELALQNIILVIHDWGGPIGIGALIDTPEKVIGLVVMNTTIFPMPKEGYQYTNFPFLILPWSYTPYFIPNVLWGGIAAYVVSNGYPQGFFTFVFQTMKRLWKHLFQSFDENDPEYVWSQMLRDSMNVASSKRQVLQTPVWGYGYEYQDKKLGKVTNYDFYKNMQATIAKKWGDISVAGFFGLWDACGKKEVIQQWQEALPQIAIHLHQYEEVGHFIEEYKGKEIGTQILAFLNRKK